MKSPQVMANNIILSDLSVQRLTCIPIVCFFFFQYLLSCDIETAHEFLCLFVVRLKFCCYQIRHVGQLTSDDPHIE